ncbi:hypothetical protein OIU85_014960 [Salix viminalis]|uniref:Uncharacterized protein n=1 Tax=Salix viminalis TaxID=40686 RepID=A0A9Q0SB96_SALVM|nr:hypothetical protein OIU85_014960 [Salix viminalis]
MKRKEEEKRNLTEDWIISKVISISFPNSNRSGWDRLGVGPHEEEDKEESAGYRLTATDAAGTRWKFYSLSSFFLRNSHVSRPNFIIQIEHRIGKDYLAFKFNEDRLSRQDSTAWATTKQAVLQYTN